jgi:hypothetical protein
MVEPGELARVEQHAGGAEALERARIVADHDHAGLAGAAAEFGGRAGAEGGIARRRRFVRDVDVEIEGQRDGKAQARGHAGRIGADRLVETVAQRGKFGDPGEALGNVVLVAVDAADEARVLPPGHRALKPAAKAQRPRHPAVPLHRPRVGLSTPARMRSKVDLPAPLAPRMPTLTRGGSRSSRRRAPMGPRHGRSCSV